MTHPFTATNWRPLRKGSLIGFVSVSMPSGMAIHEISVLETNGRFWAAPPAKPMVDRDGRVMIGDDGKRRYSPLVEFASKELRSRWSDSVIAALRAAEPGALAPQAAAPQLDRSEEAGDEVPF